MTTTTRTPAPSAASAVLATLAPVLGAGTFWVLGPAAARSGWYLLGGVAVAALVAAAGFATASANRRADAAHSTVGDWMMLGGQVAASASVALIAGEYLFEPLARPIAVLLVVAVLVFTVRGGRLPLGVRIAVPALVAATLIAVVVIVSIVPPARPESINFSGVGFGPSSALWAAGILLFAFLGVRPASDGGTRYGLLGIALGAVVLLGLGLALLIAYEWAVLTLPSATLAAAVAGTGLEPVVRVAAVVTGIASLAALADGGREVLRRRASADELPGVFGATSPRTGDPATAQIALAVAAILAVLILDVEVLATFAVAAVLLAMLLGHARAFRANALPRWIPLVGALGGAVLFALLPWAAITSAATGLAVILIVRALRGA
ncbi:hypothetical protein HQQ80_05305 [Microbacteriaceae bacterium VKM Ac-2855]|nr:hypothetical protein [Microbacteriaceae bacterium VKM Ac-2855]